jgi:acetyl-CoA carboxylase carboxyltransferase component
VEGFARPASFLELLGHYYRREVDREQGLPEEFLSALRRALAWYPGAQDGDTERQRRAIFRMYRSHAELSAKRELLRRTLFALEAYSVSEERHEELADVLDRVAVLCRSDVPALADAAIHSRYVLLDRNILNTLREEKRAKVGRILDLILKHDLDTSEDARHVRNILDTGHHVLPELVSITLDGDTAHRGLAADILGKRFTRDREFTDGRLREDEDFSAYRVQSLDSAGGHETQLYCADGARGYSAIERVLAAHGSGGDGAGTDGGGTDGAGGAAGPAGPAEVILLIRVRSGQPTVAEFAQALEGQPLSCRWLTLGVMDESGHQRFRTFFPEQPQAERASALSHEPSLDDVNPIQRRELRMQRLKNFRCRQVYGSESVFVMHATAVENERDERFIAFVDVPTARMELDEDGTIRRMVGLENVFMEAVYAMRAEQAKRRRRLYWNRIVLHIRAVLNTTLNQIREYAGNLAARTGDLGIEQLVAFSRRPAQSSAGNGAQGSTESATEYGLPAEEVELVFENISGGSFTLRRRAPSEEPLQPMDDYVARVVRARQRGTVYPYEILKMMTRSGYPVTETFPKGDFEEFDLEVDEQTGSSRAVSVKGRPYGQNSSNVVFGIVNNVLPTHPGGVKRVLILSDTTRDMGSLAEPECRRIIAALDLAEERSLPVEWLPISAGARIDMQSGTENLDWTAATLRRIVEFTQAGGEINVIVAGINVGAQSYWNAEATMLMHTRGLLIMTEEAGMLLTGKKALDFSGSVSAESNVGIGGLKRIMGPNGQAQIGASNLYEAYRILFRHYSLTYVQPGERFPRRLETGDPIDRNISVEPYEDTLGQGFEKIGDIFSNETNPGRKKPFDTRQVMEAVVDRDAETLERWRDMRDAETAVCWEARLGGYATGLIGIESRSLTRIGEVPHDGPTSWTGGTLFPLSSKKVARAINAASGKLPMVILANLSGFDGSPESLRKLQLEFGAEIGRAVVNFQGPLIFVVTARYHGGAYVVFSKMLNENLHAVALSGTYASVIGGAPAAAVVFPRVVKKNTAADPRIVEAERKLQEGEGMSQGEYEDLFQEVYAEKQSELAREFDSVHSVERAKQVGSIDEILEPDKLRPYLIQVIESGMQPGTDGAGR